MTDKNKPVSKSTTDFLDEALGVSNLLPETRGMENQDSQTYFFEMGHDKSKPQGRPEKVDQRKKETEKKSPPLSEEESIDKEYEGAREMRKKEMLQKFQKLKKSFGRITDRFAQKKEAPENLKRRNFFKRTRYNGRLARTSNRSPYESDDELSNPRLSTPKSKPYRKSTLSRSKSNKNKKLLKSDDCNSADNDSPKNVFMNCNFTISFY